MTEKTESEVKAERSPQPARAETNSDRMSNGKMLKNVFLAVVAGLFINILIGFFVNFDKLFGAFKEVSAIMVIAPFAFMLLIFIIDSLRYMLVFRKFNIHLSFRDSLYNNIIGYFFCNITPGSVGGLPFQALHFSKLGLDPVISSNVTFSRLIESNLVQLLIVALFFDKGIAMMSVNGDGSYLLIAGMIATIALTILFMLGFLNPQLLGLIALKLENSWLGKLIVRITRKPQWAESISKWSHDLGYGFKVLWKHNTGTMALDILLYMVDQILSAMGLYIPLIILTRSAVPFPEFLLSNILCALISLFIPTPGASGSVEATHLLVLGALTGKPAATLSAILIWRFGAYYLHLILGGLVYFLIPTKKNIYFKRDDGSIGRQRRTNS
ncbi:MAG TPA: lysylphosphatidylglycerol synthase transmembrane domain-containing protein [Rectinemataceae bacterium]|nr:lysylphosphatidylglycerol synthase transmembrane domain-containing protein [Rectinemataceae bacterium]